MAWGLVQALGVVPSCCAVGPGGTSEEAAGEAAYLAAANVGEGFVVRVNISVIVPVKALLECLVGGFRVVRI